MPQMVAVTFTLAEGDEAEAIWPTLAKRSRRVPVKAGGIVEVGTVQSVVYNPALRRIDVEATLNKDALRGLGL